MQRHQILALSETGQPNRWISAETAVTYHAKKLVAWELGDVSHLLFRGGINRVSGDQSKIITAPIIAIRGESASLLKRMNKIPTLSNRELFIRDRHVCAYCGDIFNDVRLTRDHVTPISRGGLDIWTNCVTACERCNNKKADKLLEEVGMELLYVPYAPNRAEHLILKGRKILQCQAEYLAQFIPTTSRAHTILNELKNIH